MNKLILSNNLKALQNLPNESVDLICTDPPFNSGRDYGEFDDRWGKGAKGMLDYIHFMNPRITECYDLVKQTGSIYLHCDTSASAYLRMCLDKVFGIENFCNEIVWCYQPNSRPSSHAFNRKHDVILLYAKEYKKNIFNRLYVPYNPKTAALYDQVDESGKHYYEYQGRKAYMKPGCAMPDYWTDIPFLTGPVSGERLGYPTQKPVALYERMIEASSNRGDVVLDMFCGSGTTLDAAEGLDRHWIGIDENPKAIETTMHRLTDKHGLLPGIHYEFIGGASGIDIPKTSVKQHKLDLG